MRRQATLMPMAAKDMNPWENMFPAPSLMKNRKLYFMPYTS